MIVRICVKNRRLKDTSSFIPLRIAYPTGMRPGDAYGKIRLKLEQTQ